MIAFYPEQLMLPAIASVVKKPVKTIMNVSGGAGSAYAWYRAIEDCGRDNVVAVFADVKGTGASHFWSDLPTIESLLHERFGGETADTYRFIWQLSHALDMPVEHIEDGRSIWSVFGQARAFRIYAGGRFLCKASEWLKREAIAQWVEQHYQPGEYRIALGMGFWEGHRVENARQWWKMRMGYDVEVYSPIADKAVDQCVISDWLNQIGVEAPEAYRRNLPHNNCRAVCVQGGQNQFAEVYRHDRLTYDYAAWQERRLQTIVGIDATILKVEREGEVRPMSLYEFAERVEQGHWNKRDLGGACSCFTNVAMTRFLAEANQAVI